MTWQPLAGRAVPRDGRRGAASVSPMRCSVAGHDAVVLDNGVIRVVIVPALGGRIWEFKDLARDREWVWHRPNITLAPPPVGATYDDVWGGGWEELFPNDAAEVVGGRALPDHGEWWREAWHVDETGGGQRAFVRLSGQTTAVIAFCVKEYSLAAGGDALQVTYRIQGREAAPAPFLFKGHFAVRITPGCHILAPGGRLYPVEPGFGTLLPTATPVLWPGGAGVDLGRVPPPSDTAREFICLQDLPAGWCAVSDAVRGASLTVEFDRAALPYLWMFLSYGGWRECYTAVMEPCTNFPKALSAAVRNETSAWLTPDEPFVTTMTFRVGAAKADPAP